MTLIKPSLPSDCGYLLGHRGARGEQLENSKAGFIHTQRLSQASQGRLVGIEFDVQLTKDGKLVVFHDDSLQRLFCRQSRVDQCTLREIQQISQIAIAPPTITPSSNKTAPNQAAVNYRVHPVLQLEDMPDLLQNYSHIELEIKTHERTNYSKLINALQHSLAESDFDKLPITLTSFDVHLLYLLQSNLFLNRFRRGLLVQPKPVQVTKKLSSISSNNITDANKTGRLDNKRKDYRNYSLMSTGEPLSHTLSIALRLQCQSIGLYYPLFDPSIIAECDQYGLTTTAWTVNNVADANYLIQMGVNYIITDYPYSFLRAYGRN